MRLIEIGAKIKRRLPHWELSPRARQVILNLVLSVMYYALVTPVALGCRALGREDRFGRGWRKPAGWRDNHQDSFDKGIYGGMA